MMKKIITALFCLASCVLFSQAFVKSVHLDLSKKADVFQIIEEDKKQVSLFFCDNRTIRCLRLDEQFTILDSINASRPSSTYNNIVGYSLSENNYWTYWSNSNNKEILAQSFDFTTKKVTDKSFRLEFEKEKALTKITIGNVFYIVTIVKNSSILNFYTFKNGTLEKKTLDLSGKRFLDPHNKPAPLWNLISESTPFEAPFSFQTIASETPPSLALSANKRKLYVFDNTLVFSMDINRKFTQTFTINLADFSVTQKVYSQPFFEDKPFDPERANVYADQSANSFMLKDAIVQIRTVDDVVKISAKNVDGQEIKTLKINADYINFKNSPIYQENGSVKSLKVIDDTGKFVRKISDLNVALSVFESDGKRHMVIGGVSLPQANDGIMIGAMFGVAGVLIATAIASNDAMNNLNSYKNRNVVYVNCLFDKDFNHLEGDAQKTGFDALRGFAEERTELTNAVVFKLNSDLYFGGFDSKSKNYSFYKFND